MTSDQTNYIKYTFFDDGYIPFGVPHGFGNANDETGCLYSSITTDGIHIDRH